MQPMLPFHTASYQLGPTQPLLIIAGPCMVESKTMGLEVGQFMEKLCREHGFNYIFKASYDKANRSSIASYRGPGLEQGLQDIASIGQKLGVPVTSDVHLPEECAQAAAYLDLLQIPAFLCRQTDLLVAAAQTDKAINVKKGQFLGPKKVKHIYKKIQEVRGAENENTLVTERGTFFGYNQLVNDFIGLGEIMEEGFPVCFDVTHSTQLLENPLGDDTTGGRAKFSPMLAKAAVAVGINCLFLEVHPNPPAAKSDAGSQLTFKQTETLFAELSKIRQAIV